MTNDTIAIEVEAKYARILGNYSDITAAIGAPFTDAQIVQAALILLSLSVTTSNGILSMILKVLPEGALIEISLGLGRDVRPDFVPPAAWEFLKDVVFNMNQFILPNEDK